MKKPEQPDLFNDWEKARIFHCIGGYYIGHFNLDCDPKDEDDPGPINRLSGYFNGEDKARSAIESGVWPAPGLEED